MCLMVMMKVYLIILFKVFGVIDYTFRAFLLFGAWIMQSHT